MVYRFWVGCTVTFPSACVFSGHLLTGEAEVVASDLIPSMFGHNLDGLTKPSGGLPGILPWLLRPCTAVARVGQGVFSTCSFPLYLLLHICSIIYLSYFFLTHLTGFKSGSGLFTYAYLNESYFRNAYGYFYIHSYHTSNWSHDLGP